MELDEVVRQEQGSGILANATVLRETLLNTYFDSFKFDLSDYTDIIRLVDGYEIMDAINDAYSELGKEETAIIVRSNKRLKRAITHLDLIYEEVEDLYRESKITTSLCEWRDMSSVTHPIIRQSLDRFENKGGYYNMDNVKH